MQLFVNLKYFIILMNSVILVLTIIAIVWILISRTTKKISKVESMVSEYQTRESEPIRYAMVQQTPPLPLSVLQFINVGRNVLAKGLNPQDELRMYNRSQGVGPRY